MGVYYFMFYDPKQILKLNPFTIFCYSKTFTLYIVHRKHYFEENLISIFGMHRFFYRPTSFLCGQDECDWKTKIDLRIKRSMVAISVTLK